MSNQTLRIATRKSPLAMWQAEHVAQQLRLAHAGLQVELVGMSTQGDKILDVPLAMVGGKGLFVKEIEEAMLRDEIDIAVHSMKDVPADMPAGFCIAALLERASHADALVSPGHAQLTDLREGALVGSSSLRRQAQLRMLRPDLRIEPLRGNVNTRLAKLDAGDYDAIILAAAGLIAVEDLLGVTLGVDAGGGEDEHLRVHDGGGDAEGHDRRQGNPRGHHGRDQGNHAAGAEWKWHTQRDRPGHAGRATKLPPGEVARE